MYTLGSGFIPSPNHAGGLRYHGMSSIVSQLYHDGYMEARAVEQTKVFEAAEQFARIEGSCPRRSPATPSASPSTRPSNAARPARQRPSFSV